MPFVVDSTNEKMVKKSVKSLVIKTTLNRQQASQAWFTHWPMWQMTDIARKPWMSCCVQCTLVETNSLWD